ncbi:uncharacterized protein TNCV_4300191 [Trichonephila clavipes]|nr:uncharacterized protein TNCV_4300191 [Trichonephila clavipes]
MPRSPQFTRFRYRKSSLFGNSTPSLCELDGSISTVLSLVRSFCPKSTFVLVNSLTPSLSAPQSVGSLLVHSGSSLLQTHCRLRSVGNREAHCTGILFHPSDCQWERGQNFQPPIYATFS